MVSSSSFITTTGFSVSSHYSTRIFTLRPLSSRAHVDGDVFNDLNSLALLSSESVVVNRILWLHKLSLISQFLGHVVRANFGSITVHMY